MSTSARGARHARLIQAGATPEDRREAMREKARVRRAARAHLPKRDILFDSTTGQILNARRDRAVAQEAELRKQLPQTPAPDVQIVRPDLVEAAKNVKHRSQRQRVAAVVKGSAATGGDRADPFAQLADRQEGGERVASDACSWADYAAEQVEPDAPAQEADRGSVFDRLADVG